MQSPELDFQFQGRFEAAEQGPVYGWKVVNQSLRQGGAAAAGEEEVVIVSGAGKEVGNR